MERAGTAPSIRSTYQYFGYTLNQNGSLRTYGGGAATTRPTSTPGWRSRRSAGARRSGSRSSSPSPFSHRTAAAPSSATTRSGRSCGSTRRAGAPAPQPLRRRAAPDRRRPSTRPTSPTSPSFVRAGRSTLDVRAITELYQQRLESLLAVDEAVAAIVVALRKSGELDNTLIVFTSDNGYLHGEHRIPAGKGRVYEPSIRVPLVVRGPGIPRGHGVSTLVANIDLAPTLLDAANARPGRVLDGRSLFPLLQQPAAWAPRDILLERASSSADFEGIRTPSDVYVEYRSGEKELYDLVRDPDQLQSHHASAIYRQRLRELAGRLAALRRCSGASC